LILPLAVALRANELAAEPLAEFNLAASREFLSCVIDELLLGLKMLSGTARERDG
jgi:hypothetical protein